jgi:hypothetical protein
MQGLWDSCLWSTWDSCHFSRAGKTWWQNEGQFRQWQEVWVSQAGLFRQEWKWKSYRKAGVEGLDPGVSFFPFLWISRDSMNNHHRFQKGKRILKGSRGVGGRRRGMAFWTIILARVPVGMSLTPLFLAWGFVLNPRWLRKVFRAFKTWLVDKPCSEQSHSTGVTPHKLSLQQWLSAAVQIFVNLSLAHPRSAWTPALYQSPPAFTTSGLSMSFRPSVTW